MDARAHRLSGRTLRLLVSGVNSLVTDMEEPTETPGELLRAFVEAHKGHRTWTDLAEHAGVRRQTLYDWFSGKDKPSMASLRVLAEALRVRPYQLVAAMDGDGEVMPVESEQAQSWMWGQMDAWADARGVPRPRRTRPTGEDGEQGAA